MLFLLFARSVYIFTTLQGMQRKTIGKEKTMAINLNYSTGRKKICISQWWIFEKRKTTGIPYHKQPQTYFEYLRAIVVLYLY